MSEPLRILYVDDDEAIARLVEKHLSRAGHRVTLASNGEAGIRAAGAERFDLIALDHYMPGADGLEVMSELLEMPDPPPIIIVTAAEEPRIAVAALTQGAADYVLKDIGGAFLDALSAAITRARDQERLRREKEKAEAELRESRDRLEKLAQQQAIMLREVNHRVANSLQLISAMIGLQARRAADPETRETLHRAAERVEAVNLVHRRLYTSGDVQFVDMKPYLAGLIAELGRAGAGEETARRVELSAEPVRLETDKAVAIGLIVNELVTNALKYAYPPGEEGAVRVRWARDREGGLCLSVEDDGMGIAETAPGKPQGPDKPQGLGALIVRSMAESLGATVAIDPSHEPGTRYVVRLGAQAEGGSGCAPCGLG